MCINCWFIFKVNVLTLYIINKNYQWILTFGLLKYILPSKLLGLFSYTCMLQFFFNLYFIYLFLCYSYIFCFHFIGWRKRWIIHIASSVMLQNAENVMSKLNIFSWKKFQEKNYIEYMYKQWFKNKVKHTQRAHYICVEINRYYFCTEKEHYNCP
jgi:hypothetical protein